jgi:hypothetical protein
MKTVCSVLARNLDGGQAVPKCGKAQLCLPDPGSMVWQKPLPDNDHVKGY